MVASIAALKSAKQASAYYELDDYYAEDDQAPSAWKGHGAEALGLAGPVDREQFAALLSGKLPSGQQLGTFRDGGLEHRPGVDITYSACKSVSIMAEVVGDRRLVEAHEEAVRIALDYVERHAITTRIRATTGLETVLTSRMLAAMFRHNTSRALDPQLHTHTVVMNATLDDDGQWRSIESRSLFQIYKDSGAIYRQALAGMAKELGYELREGADSMFELACVPDEMAEAFSTRGAQIERRLAQRGKTRSTASAAEKSIVALGTRSRKVAAERGRLVDAWRDQADAAGFDMEELRNRVTEAVERATTLADTAQSRKVVARRAVEFAARKLGEREAVFSAAQFERSAGEFALGRASLADIAAAAKAALERGDLIARAMNRGSHKAGGLATRAAVEAETRMLDLEQRGRGTVEPPFDRIEASRLVARAEIGAADEGRAWNDPQRAATRGLLASTSSISGLQGYAGTAKTSTVLSTYAEGMRGGGFRIRAFAPTAAAAEELGKAIKAEAETIARLLSRARSIVNEACEGREAWIVDEASMVSAADMDRVLDLAARARARVVLVGDVRQLGSVEAGQAFGQLQANGMETFVLDQIVRQTNEMTKAAVEATIAGDSKRVFDALDRGGGSVTELSDAEDRYNAMAQDYAKLTPEERARTLVLDPSRVGRQRLTDAIRMALVADRTLGDEAIRVLVLEPRGLTKAEGEQARSYRVGDIITFRRSFKSRGVQAGEGYRVSTVDPEANRIELRDAQGGAITWSLDRWGRGQAEAFTEVEREFRVGDRIQFTRNDYAARRTNGAEAVITSFDPDAKTITTTSGRRGQQTLDLKQTRDCHFRHGWVRTVHSAQGSTANHVLAHLESFRANTVNARSVYVAISRARVSAAIFTDNRTELVTALSGRTGEKQTALLYEQPSISGQEMGELSL